MIDALKEEFVRIGTGAEDKDSLLAEIAKAAKESPLLSGIKENEILKALKNREQLSSTGLQKGIAIPHCTFDGLKDFVVGLIIIPKGIDFDSIDGKKSDLVFYIIGPSERRNRHIKILSSISRLAKDDKLLDSLKKADGPRDAVSLLCRDKENIYPGAAGQKCQLTVNIQDEELMFDVLNILTSEIEGSVTVLDGTPAGSYLHRMPLFSSFWNEEAKAFSKIIIAVLDKQFLNDTLRRINMVRPEDGHGILIAVSDLIYIDGSIDF